MVLNDENTDSYFHLQISKSMSNSFFRIECHRTIRRHDLERETRIYYFLLIEKHLFLQSIMKFLFN